MPRQIGAGRGGLAVVVAAAALAGALVSQAKAPSAPMWHGADGSALPFQQPEEIEDFLATATIVENKGIKTGTTGPRKLLLELNGVRAHAKFNSVDELKHRGPTNLGGFTVADVRDYHLYNCAAYRVDLLLGLGRVPPSVPRTVGRRSGTVTLWIEHTLMEKHRQAKRIEPPDPYHWEQQKRIMYVFDNLIGNMDRNLGNILVDRSWNLWFIDHTLAFVTSPLLPNPNGARKCERRLYERLRDLEPSTIRRELEPFLDPAEIDALLARRDKILERLDAEIAARGERLVLFDLRPAPSPVDSW